MCIALRRLLTCAGREGRAARLGPFDVVVIGGGAAGCVVAARLAESGARSVLLVEAGPDPGIGTGTDLSAELRDGWHLSRQFDWGYRSEPDELGVVQDLRRCKLLGGTGWLTRFALRGAPGDFDEWRDLGNVGWGFEDVLPYLKRIENDLDFGDQPWHGNSGPIPITRYRELDPTEIGAAVLRAYGAVGFPAVEDHNQPGAVGAGRMPMSSRDGVRMTTAQAYLRAGAARPILTIKTSAQVADILFEGTRAAGIRLLDGTVIGAGCVVLSAGTYGSPSILMRSGIGPPEHLRALGLPVRVALPGVGQNLMDHTGVDIDCGYRGASRTAPLFRYVATFHSSDAVGSAAPDLMLWPFDPVGNPPAFSIDVALLKPRSRGRVTLRSAAPTDPPRIELPNFSEPSDLERLAEGYRRGWEVASHPDVRRLCVDPVPPEIHDPKELLRTVRQNAYSLPHVVGTCAMGPSPDEGAVVDVAGRVYGTERLFVVDASVMPTVPSGFTHMPTIMIAERLAEQIAALS